MQLRYGVLLAILLPAIYSFVDASDLIVRENGVFPEFSTISDAVTAASEGDRILIFNKTGNTPYNENVTLNKSLTFLPAICLSPTEDSCFFYVSGTWTVHYNANAERNISIIGMRNLSSGITYTGSGSLGPVNYLNIHGCWFENGSIQNKGVYTRTEVTNCRLDNGGIGIRNGMVAGNIIHGSISVDPAVFLSPYGEDIPSDMFIVGNRLTDTGSRIIWNNNGQNFVITNNFIEECFALGPFTNPGGAIWINLSPQTGSNFILNNTVVMGAVSSANLRAISVINTNRVRIENNVLISGGAGDYGIVSNAGNPTKIIAYNLIQNFQFPISGGGHVEMNNDTTSIVSWDSVSGYCLSPACINSGNPGNDVFDLDLTRNDKGSAGGWFHPDNYFPLYKKGTQVYMLSIPLIAVQKEGMEVKAKVYDN